MSSRWPQVALGIWLVAAALLLAAEGNPARSADLGAGVALVAIALLAAPGTPDGRAAVVLGSWVMLAPTALAYPSARAALLDVLTGLAVVAVALHPDAGRRRAAGA